MGGCSVWCGWLAAAVALVTYRAAGGFVLEGSPTSFAQFPRWVPGPNGSLEFEFLTREPSGLFLYTDDGGSYEFFEVKLIEGAVRLHYNLGGGARLLTVGRGLNDGTWHKVRVSRRHDRTQLTVDGATETRSAKALVHEFGSPASNSFVYVGGLPELLTRQVGAKLTLPVITLEPRFAGQFRNLVYTGADGKSRQQDMIASQVSPRGSRARSRDARGPAAAKARGRMQGYARRLFGLIAGPLIASHLREASARAPAMRRRQSIYRPTKGRRWRRRGFLAP